MSKGKEYKEEITKKTKEAYIESLRQGTTRAEAAEAAKTTTTTIWRWAKEDEEFAKAVEIALESRITVVEDALYKDATSESGNQRTIAKIFWLKNRGRGKWRDKQDIEVVMPKVIHEVHYIQSGKPPVIAEEPEIEEKKEEN